MKFLICLALIAFTQAVVIKHASNPHAAVFAQLENLEDNPLGKKILDTIAIQMRNQSPLSDIAKMLQDLRENLVLQQQDAELVHVAQEADCEAEIYGYNRRIEFASNEITEATMDINKYTSEIELLQQEIENQVIQLRILNEQEEQLREQRAEDHAAYQEREIQTPKVVEALDVIAAKLSAIQPEADAEVVLAELERVGGENPILALVQLASTFSAEKLQSVQAKIGELRASLEQALIDDREQEIQSQLNFEAQIYSIEEQREAIQSAKAEAETKIVQVEHMLAAAKKRKYDAGRELESATNGKKMKEAQCDNWRSLYARDTEQRTTEISIIRQVESILATKLEGASNYIKGRIN
ncbi:unnamed protein product [Paramecium primaurelia]|uniref:Trichocyst matrix protein n=1 Tax=Paramecium primaurelia TaxID=5886 RepID=A0A8S1Q8L1_PARPR|nr:unnamed protein product [Paramecium primaurelia]